MHYMQRNYAFLTLLLMLAVLMGSLGGVSSSARKSGADEPASGGRARTPAGSLMPGMTTRPPAGRPPRVGFRRRPLPLRRCGGGLCFISGDNGFVVQVNCRRKSVEA